MERKRRYDEDKELPSPWEWVIITLFSLSIMAFALIVYSLVDDGPRRWDFGQLPDTPAESIYSTEPPPAAGVPPRQVRKLPEAVPENAPKPPHVQLKERERRQ